MDDGEPTGDRADESGGGGKRGKVPTPASSASPSSSPPPLHLLRPFILPLHPSNLPPFPPLQISLCINLAPPPSTSSSILLQINQSTTNGTHLHPQMGEGGGEVVTDPAGSPSPSESSSSHHPSIRFHHSLPPSPSFHLSSSSLPPRIVLSTSCQLSLARGRHLAILPSPPLPSTYN